MNQRNATSQDCQRATAGAPKTFTISELQETLRSFPETRRLHEESNDLSQTQALEV
ncbi:Uncharacterized protein DAT39_013221 [Clarias magur]|uniref:Uncharacterized protein n=1 Tax=Clarias magur TaxID=1594786 RepID=A0A8J4TYL4_CLAMG|nr:Uncharacterized protein DAT39_013221 [Clarias magur]